VEKTRILMILMVPLFACLLYACANTNSMYKVHPSEVKGLPDCTECHTDNWAALNHKAVGFYEKHRYYAEQQKFACSVCHEESFCADCHAHKEEIKPSDKYKDSPERALPHRGDYLSQHKIDGRIDPASCVKCHGRTNNERCKECHR
jgi:hypothetical protein